MTSTDPMAGLRAHATRTWSADAADDLVTHLVPDPAQLLTKDHLDLRLAMELGTFRGEVQADIADLRIELRTGLADVRGEIGDLRTEVRTGLTDVRGELHTGLADVRDELHTGLAAHHTEIGDLRTEVRTALADVRSEIASSAAGLQVAMHRDMINQTKWVVGALLSGIFAFGSLLVAAAVVIG